MTISTKQERTAIMPTHYVLLVEHGDRETIDKPHDVSVHASLTEAEAALRKYAEKFLAEVAGLQVLLVDEDLIDELAQYGVVDVRIFECSADGNVYVEPFASLKAA